MHYLFARDSSQCTAAPRAMQRRSTRGMAGGGSEAHTSSVIRPQRQRGSRIVLTCVGSLGDLHPYLAVAGELARRGHYPVVATLPVHRERVESSGLIFHPIRAATTDAPNPELMRRVFNGRKGVEFIVRELILPALRTAYNDTCLAAAGADLLIAHPLTFATRLVAETRDIPWISTQLAPCGVISALDPPTFPGLGWLHRLHAPAAVWRGVWKVAERGTRSWVLPYDDLRVQLGVRDLGNPLFSGGHSPIRELAWFSPHFGHPQPDWPKQTIATGFPYFTQPATPPDLQLDEWLGAGAPPIVFTLGSSAVMDPGSFFVESAKAALRLGRRALLLGADAEAMPPKLLTPAVFIRRYAPYAGVFAKAAVVVHQGGIGTTAEALRAGHPALIVPYGADQPDNAARAKRLGVARVISRGQYRSLRVARELRKLLERKTYAERARAMGAAIRAEDGLAAACDVIEEVLQNSLSRVLTAAL